MCVWGGQIYMCVCVHAGLLHVCMTDTQAGSERDRFFSLKDPRTHRENERWTSRRAYFMGPLRSLQPLIPAHMHMRLRRSQQ